MNESTEIRLRNLERLERMRDEGILTEDEFQRERSEVCRLNPVIQAEVSPIQGAPPDQSEANDTSDDYIYYTAHEKPTRSGYRPGGSVGEWLWPTSLGAILVVAAGYIYLSKATVHAGLYEVTARSLNCRAEPTSTSSIVTQYMQGQEISVTGKQNDWLKVKADNDCWVSSEFAQKKEIKSNNAEQTAGATSYGQAGKKLTELFQNSTIGAQTMWLESKIGPAKTIVGHYRSYDVDGCGVMIIDDESGKIVSLRIQDITTPRCNVNVSEFIADSSFPKTFGDLYIGNINGEFYSDCLNICGNASDPEVRYSIGGFRANGFIRFVASTFVRDDSGTMPAVERWSNALIGRYGAGATDYGQFEGRDNLQVVAHEAFRNVPIQSIAIELDM